MSENQITSCWKVDEMTFGVQTSRLKNISFFIFYLFIFHHYLFSLILTPTSYSYDLGKIQNAQNFISFICLPSGSNIINFMLYAVIFIILFTVRFNAVTYPKC